MSRNLKLIVTQSIMGNRQFVCFEVNNKTLTLLPYFYESRGEFTSLNPGNYEFMNLGEWVAKQTNGHFN